MARLHHFLSRALTSHHGLPPSPTTSTLRPHPLRTSARPPLPPLSPPHSSPPYGRTLLPFVLAATSRHYASSTPGRRRRSSSPPMLLRRRRARRPTRKGPGELSVQIGIEEALPDDPEILSIAETLQTDVGKAMKVAFDGLEGSEYKTRDPCISNVNKYYSIETSLLLCDDNFIKKLNKEWRDEDRATDVLSMSQHIPGLDIPILQLGDIVISVETARRQAEERGHPLLDEIRILMVHGLLHLLGFDHELSKEAEEEMEKEEERILNTLEWKGKGLIKSAYDVATDVGHSEISVEANSDVEKMTLQEDRQPKLSHIICDIDGTLVDEGHLHEESMESLREAISRGVNVIMVTGKSRASTIRTLKLLDFRGKCDFVSEASPGVFLQGSLVYGRHGQEIYRANLDVDICKEAVLYSLKHKIPLVAYCGEQCLTLFEHPFVDMLHTVHHETKVKVMHSIEDLLEYSSIQCDLDAVGDYTGWLSNKRSN
ncbi:endoribonuclease YBEY, chloroplastic-like isoform X2 [Phragmites australis]|uniref:endoribonuclease YBEY, chloroplastic-like isoform X2 n=1 Tax=Phragmites australis TaxID=29695 RepID=UPI002D784F3B|nr:endoribonuclease YBEY, chloroplastic-like isoform X2 [Phragmites australis]